MKRAIGLVVVMLTAGMAGCIGGDDAPVDAANANDTSRHDQASDPLSLSSCHEAFGQWDLPYEEVAPYLPPEFEPAGGAPGASETGRNASMELIAISCGEPRNASFFFPWLIVEPPDELANPDATYRFVALSCIADARTAETLRSWGAPCEAGQVGITRDANARVGGAWTVTAESPNRTVTLEGAGAETPTASGVPETIQLFHAVDANLCAITTVDVGEHIHTEPGPFTLEVQGEAGFPVPEGPSAGSLVRSAFGLNATNVATDPRPTAESEVCPDASGDSGVEEGGG